VTRPPAVLVTGWATTARIWEPFLPVLEEQAATRALDWQRCLPDRGDAIGEFLARAPEPVVGVGASLGALLLLDAARRHPGRVRALVLLAGTARLCADGTYAGAAPSAVAAMHRRLGRDRGRVLRAFFASCFPKPVTPAVLDRLCADAAGIPTTALEAGLAYLARADLRDALPGIPAPALVVHGDRDAGVPLASARALADNLPQAEFVVVPGAGHAVAFSAFERVKGAVQAFLRDVLSR
jgi:pimeloyl-ACP methyl ester carboxylesterase